MEIIGDVKVDCYLLMDKFIVIIVVCWLIE